MVAPSPEQAKKINTYKVALDNEVLDAKFTKTKKLIEDDSKKECTDPYSKKSKHDKKYRRIRGWHQRTYGRKECGKYIL